MGDGQKFVCELEKLLREFESCFVGALGRSRKLILSWRKRNFKCSNIFSFSTGLGIVLHAQEPGVEVTVLSLYGPYVDLLTY
jgi:hypothetical protein